MSNKQISARNTGFEVHRHTQIEIPKTTIQQYITGIYALNIPNAEGHAADWHPDIFFSPIGSNKNNLVTLGGEGSYDTNEILGTYGVANLAARLKQIINTDQDTVYCANHVRALMDLLVHELTTYGQPMTTIGGVDTWLNDEEKESFYNLIQKYAAHVSDTSLGPKLTDWLNSEY